MPAERTKKTKTSESVPDAGNPDRKRVLNVLAQRRYRQRRKERLEALEAQAKGVALQQSRHQCADVRPLPEPQLSLDSCSGSTIDIATVEEVARTISDECSPPFDFDQVPFDLDFIQDLNALPSLLSPTISTASPTPPTLFPLTADGAVLSMPLLNALHAFASIAMVLDVATHIWDPFYLHVLPASIPALSTLPVNLHPVAAQYTVPHHPILDLLPWPSVREKLICVLSLPSFFRPPIAQEEQDDHGGFSTAASLLSDRCNVTSSHGAVKQSGAIVQLVQDMDDFQDGGGVRVHGNTTTWHEGNELVEESWEIGDSFYHKWWWCLDHRIVEVSNRRRRERGLGRLKMMEKT